MNIKKYIFAKGASQKIPVSGTFELTARCNFDCKMCYIHGAENDKGIACRELTTQQWLELGEQAVKMGMMYLLLTGGEPLLRNDFCEIYTEMAKKGVLISVNTNASCINDRIIKCFLQHPPERINVTLYGSSGDTYKALCRNENGFEKSRDGILALKKAGLPVMINTTFTSYNKDDLKELVDFAKKHQIPIRTASYIFPPVRKCGGSEAACFLSPEEMGLLSARFDAETMTDDQFRDRVSVFDNISGEEEASLTDDPAECSASSCMAGRGAFWMTWDGEMIPCGMINNISARPLEIGFSDAWRFICEQTKTMLLPKECSDCKYKKLCPSCAAIGFARHGDSSVLAPEMCRYIKAYQSGLMDLTKK